MFLCFLFAAIASPTPDAGSMLVLAFPMVALYLIAVGHRLRRRPPPGPAGGREGAADLSDDEASPLDDDTGFDPHDEVDAQAATTPRAREARRP